MKQIFFLCLLAVLGLGNISGQCSLSDLTFNVEFGESLYNAEIKIASQGNKVTRKSNSLFDGPEWIEGDFIGKDSVVCSSRTFLINNHKCFTGFDNEAVFLFMDDKLVNITISFSFKDEHLSEMINTFNNYKKLIDEGYIFDSKKYYYNKYSDEKIGEIYSYNEGKPQNINKRSSYINFSKETYDPSTGVHYGKGETIKHEVVISMTDINNSVFRNLLQLAKIMCF